jgi:hypothetical protein
MIRHRYQFRPTLLVKTKPLILSEIPKDNLFHDARVNTFIATAEPPRKFDIRKIPYKLLSENPKFADTFLGMLYQSYPHFNPIADVIQKIDANPNLSLPKGYLEKAFFVDAYKELFGLDLKEIILNDRFHSLNRVLQFLFGTAEFAVKAMPLGLALGTYFTSNSNETPVSALLVLAGLSTAVPPQGIKDSPLALLARALLSFGGFPSKITGDKFSKLITTWNGFFSHAPKNLFLAKHLDFTGKAKKYFYLFLHGPYAIERGLRKDCSETFGIYKYARGQIDFAKNLSTQSGVGVAKLLAGAMATTLDYVPASAGDVSGLLVHTITQLSLVLFLGTTAQGKFFDAHEMTNLLYSASLILGATFILKVQVERIASKNPAKATTYEIVSDFMVSMLTLLSANVEKLQSLVGYSTAIAGSIGLLLGFGLLVRAYDGDAKTYK